MGVRLMFRAEHPHGNHLGIHQSVSRNVPRGTPCRASHDASSQHAKILFNKNLKNSLLSVWDRGKFLGAQMFCAEHRRKKQ